MCLYMYISMRIDLYIYTLVYIYIYIYIYIFIYILYEHSWSYASKYPLYVSMHSTCGDLYIYIYIERERERNKDHCFHIYHNFYVIKGDCMHSNVLCNLHLFISHSISLSLSIYIYMYIYICIYMCVCVCACLESHTYIRAYKCVGIFLVKSIRQKYTNKWYSVYIYVGSYVDANKSFELYWTHAHFFISKKVA